MGKQKGSKSNGKSKTLKSIKQGVLARAKDGYLRNRVNETILGRNRRSSGPNGSEQPDSKKSSSKRNALDRFDEKLLELKERNLHKPNPIGRRKGKRVVGNGVAISLTESVLQMSTLTEAVQQNGADIIDSLMEPADQKIKSKLANRKMINRLVGCSHNMFQELYNYDTDEELNANRVHLAPSTLNLVTNQEEMDDDPDL